MACLILISDLKEYKNQVKSFNLWVFTRIFIDSFEGISIIPEWTAVRERGNG